MFAPLFLALACLRPILQRMSASELDEPVGHTNFSKRNSDLSFVEMDQSYRNRYLGHTYPQPFLSLCLPFYLEPIRLLILLAHHRSHRIWMGLLLHRPASLARVHFRSCWHWIWPRHVSPP